MKFIIVLIACIGLALSAPAKDDTIVKYDADVREDGYNFAYEISDGTLRQETGELINAGTDEAAIAVRGSVSWVAADGQTYKLSYVADENGFHPEADHLPKQG